jgi:hypothetical protein
MKGNGFKIRKKATGLKSFLMDVYIRVTILMASHQAPEPIFGLMVSAMTASGSMDSNTVPACGVAIVETPTRVSGSLTNPKVTVFIPFPTGITMKDSSKNA